LLPRFIGKMNHPSLSNDYCNDVATIYNRVVYLSGKK